MYKRSFKDVFFKPFIFSTFQLLVYFTHKTLKEYAESLKVAATYILLRSLWIFLSKKTAKTIPMHYESMNLSKNGLLHLQNQSKGFHRWVVKVST